MTGPKLSRRQFAQTLLGTTAFVAFAAPARGQAATFELGGQVSGWVGQSPPPIEGNTNPTLQMKAGKDYVIAWENMDGHSHNVAIGDGEGNVLERTEVVETRGATQTLEFTATPKMKTYFSEFDPETMRGKIEVVQPTTTSGTANNTSATNGTVTGTTSRGTTPTPTKTTAVSATTSSAPTETSNSTGGETTSTTDGGDLPGFGLLAALGSIASLGYLIHRNE
jgi:plastocyanin